MDEKDGQKIKDETPYLVLVKSLFIQSFVDKHSFIPTILKQTWEYEIKSSGKR